MLKNWLLNSVAVFSPPDEGAPGAADPPAGDAQTGAGDGAGEAGDAGGAEGGGASGDGADGGDGAGDGTPAPAAKVTEDWRDKEIKRKHAQLQTEKRERTRLQQELEDTQALLARAPKKDGEAAPAPAAPARTFTKEDVDRAAAAQVAQTTYNQQCDDTFNKGKAAYKDDWDNALSRLNLLGGLGDGEQGVEVMQGILAADDPAKVLYVLGTNPDEYHRVMGLPPARRLAEIVKLGIPDKKPPAKKPSTLDPPVNGITRRAQVDNAEAKLYDDKTSDEDWYAARTAQKARNFAKTGNPFKSA